MTSKDDAALLLRDLRQCEDECLMHKDAVRHQHGRLSQKARREIERINALLLKARKQQSIVEAERDRLRELLQTVCNAAPYAEYGLPRELVLEVEKALQPDEPGGSDG